MTVLHSPTPARPTLAGPARPSAQTPGGIVVAVVRTARPRQWVKNLLVLAAPAAAGALVVPATISLAAAAFVAFTLAAAGTYFVNDARDVDADRAHPVKRSRPVAAEQLSPRTAVVVAAVCGLSALAVAASIGAAFTGVVVAYLLLTTAYSAGLKKVPVLEVLVVAAGFVLRAAGGAAATGVPLSSWFLLVALFGSLFLVVGKRAAELAVTPAGGRGRAVLRDYPEAWVTQTLTMALTATVVSYALWAVQYVGEDSSAPVLAASLVPFLAVLMRYNLLLARGGGEQPEVEATTDRFLLSAGAVWLALLVVGLYLI